VEELGGIDAAVTARGHAAIDLGVFGTFTHAIRAWHAANGPGAEDDAAERFEASLRNVEEAAALAQSSARPHLLEAARLLRTGDPAGARAAFEEANPAAANVLETAGAHVSPRSAIAGHRAPRAATHPRVLAGQ
jgi:Flp pilus assembly protein TadD